jgi:hypothetical protein
MKPKIAMIAVVFACACSARGTLIDLTPGGFDPNNAPPVFYEFLTQATQHQFAFFDNATPTGWTSLFGELNGGTYFDTDLFGHQTESAQVSWDFSALPGYSMSRLLIFGRDDAGMAWMNLYTVPHNFRLFNLDQIMLHADADILSISFYGRTPNSPVPDTGTTIGLLAIAFCALVLFPSLPRHDLSRRWRAL